MKSALKTACLLILITLAEQPSFANDIKMLTWIEGYWIEDKADGSRVAIQWGPLEGNAMTGTWRKIQDDKLVGYEILTMTETTKGITYRYDYFGAKDGFKTGKANYFDLVSLNQNKALFKERGTDWHLTLEITAEGKLKGYQRKGSAADLPTYVGYEAQKTGH